MGTFSGITDGLDTSDLTQTNETAKRDLSIDLDEMLKWKLKTIRKTVGTVYWIEMTYQSNIIYKFAIR